jgi:uncharacterized protein
VSSANEACAAADWSRVARPDAFPEEPRAAQVEWIQTHLSHVFLTAARVYKFRKPVDLGFVRFTSLEERNRDCLREVALNRRLAPDVYLGVAPLLGPPDRPRIGVAAETLAAADVEHCVVMRRLAAGRDALSLLERGALGAAEIDALAGLLAAFHRANRLGAPAPFNRDEWLAHCTGPVEDNYAALAAEPQEAAPRALVARARDLARSFAARHPDRFEIRRSEGRAVEGHGDLRLEHVWFEDAGHPPVVIDCVEFSEPLRRIDAASEVAFAAMDLRYRGSALAERVLRSYARESDDFGLYAVVDYFVAYRAAVRAKVAALAARDEAVPPAQRGRAAESARRHLLLAVDALEKSGAPSLVIVSGIVGTGKSTVAARLADRLDAVVVASDRVRKRLFAAAPTDRLAEAWGRGAYAPEHTDRVYAGLLERARSVIDSGRTAILDATFSKRAQRDAALRFAGELGCAAFLVEAHCEPDVARERMARRKAAGTDPSDAGPESYAPSARRFEPPEEWAASRRARIATDRESWEAALAPIERRIRDGI